jgi:hypothetical protein
MSTTKEYEKYTIQTEIITDSNIENKFSCPTASPKLPPNIKDHITSLISLSCRSWLFIFFILISITGLPRNIIKQDILYSIKNKLLVEDSVLSNLKYLASII